MEIFRIGATRVAPWSLSMIRLPKQLATLRRGNPSREIRLRAESAHRTELHETLAIAECDVANMAACAQTNGTGSGACTNYIASINHLVDTDNDTFRVDENLGEKDRVYVTGILGEQKDHNPSIMPLTGELKYQKNKLLGVSWQHTITPSIINEFRIGYNWMRWRNGSDATGGANYGSQLGFANVPGNPGLWGVPKYRLQRLSASWKYELRMDSGRE